MPTIKCSVVDYHFAITGSCAGLQRALLLLETRAHFLHTKLGSVTSSVKRSKFFWICLGLHLQNVLSLSSLAILSLLGLLLRMGFNNDNTELSMRNEKILSIFEFGALLSVNL